MVFMNTRASDTAILHTPEFRAYVTGKDFMSFARSFKKSATFYRLDAMRTQSIRYVSLEAAKHLPRL